MFTTVYFELSLGHTNGGILGLGGIPCFVLSLRVTWNLLWGFCCCKDINSVWNLQYVLGLRLVLCVLLGYILFCADA